MNLRKPILLMSGAALCFAAGYGWHRWSSSGPPPAAKVDQAAALQPMTVKFARDAPQLQFLRSEQVVLLSEPLIEPLNGKVTYDENYTARVSTPIAGRVTQILVQPGDSVKAGATLAWIDAPDYGAAAADVGKSKNDVQQKERAYERARALLAEELLSQRDFEAAETELKQAQAESRRAQLRLRNLVPGRAQANDDGRFAVRSPISGVIADRQINPGSEVRPDAPNPLFTITDPTHVWVMIDLPERYLRKVKVGQIVEIEVDAYKGADLSGRIASIGEVLDPATRRVQVRCVVNNPLRLLKPEMYARVVPLAAEHERLARVSNGAFVSEGLYTFVFVEREPGHFEKRKVVLGLQGRDESYVKSGLKEGERVVVNGSLLLASELSARP